MKKSVKEELEKHSVTPYPHKGWQSEFVVPVSVVMRIIRRACNEAYEAGVTRVDVGPDYVVWPSREDQKADVSEIINGPKKGKRK